MPKQKCAFNSCNKKIKIIDILVSTCKCKLIFCSNHRLPETHDCSYNFQNEINKEAFIEENKCMASKFNKFN